MGAPWMTEPKPDERINHEWRLLDGTLPSISWYGETAGSACAAWRRPDPNYEHPDAGEVIDETWRFVGSDGRANQFPLPSSLNQVVDLPGWWVRPIRRTSEPTTHTPAPLESELRIFMQSAHEVGLRGQWPEYDCD